MLSKSLYVGKTKDITELAFKLQEKNYDVRSVHKLIILRPTFKKYITDGKILLSVNKVTLIHSGEYIFIKVKLNYYLYFVGIILLFVHIEKTINLDYATYLKRLE